jgi:ParB family transcriptional regulator, chromosome partitioning protein
MAKAGILKNLQSRTGTKDNSAVSLTVKDIPIGEIQIKENIRSNYDDAELEELQASIREYGLIQPITVYAAEDGYAVKIGHRRLMAYKMLYKEEPERYHSIRCIISDNQNTVFIQLIENIQRVDLSQIDLCNAYTALKDKGMTMKEIAMTSACFLSVVPVDL